MSEICSKCGAHLSSPWRFCPNCGVTISPEVRRQPSPAEPEKAPVQGAFSGLLFGMIVAPICIIVGTMLCLTGLGAFLGIPMIIAGVLAPLLGPMIGIGELKGKCPWCGSAVSNIVNAPGFDCHVCSKRIAVQDRKFVKAA
jgi:DNA-directed RNA polymerase subunit RPC12/RpoP